MLGSRSQFGTKSYEEGTSEDPREDVGTGKDKHVPGVELFLVLIFHKTVIFRRGEMKDTPNPVFSRYPIESSKPPLSPSKGLNKV